jgi:protein disulfide-isomerase A6
VQGYPTLKYFTAGQPEDYNGGRSKSDILSFADSKADTASPPKLVTELNSQETFDDYCKNDKGVCIIAFLPHIQESGEEKRK